MSAAVHGCSAVIFRHEQIMYAQSKSKVNIKGEQNGRRISLMPIIIYEHGNGKYCLKDLHAILNYFTEFLL